MSILLCNLRSRFLKHLAYTYSFSIHLTSQNTFPFSRSSPVTERNYKQPNLITATFSTSASYYSEIDSSKSPYFSVHIRCPRDAADMLSEALLCFGASSTSMDESDRCNPSDEICIGSTFSVCQDVHKSISHAADSIGLRELPSYDVTVGYQSDWIKESQESFHPVEVTEGIWIVPEWKTPPVLQATNIILNPGLAFGTGDHPTTKLCLLLLHSLIKGGEFFLDYGTGSGILAIAALKFGAALSVGTDIDPQAITAARHNASLNNISPEILQLHLVSSKNSSCLTDEMTSEGVEEHKLYGTGFISETEKYDVVIANILLNPLLDLADQIVSYSKPGAVVGVSGIISEQVPRIIERYSHFLDDITVSKLDDWACISGTKKMNP